MPPIEVFAPAKVNLALHVTGRRADGYHLLDSLVAFAPFGDHLTLVPAPALSLTVTGPEGAGVPEGPENLVLRAAALVPGGQGAAITLDKRLPPASGIGGGSSDAAAMLRGLALLRGASLPEDRGLELGADVPMCLDPRPARVRGIGEDITPVTLPPLPAVLVNPRGSVPTPAVFKALTERDNPPMATIPGFASTADCIDWLAGQRNDLEPPAKAIAPGIAAALSALATLPGCRLARMSGSGATCFGLFATLTEAETALTRLRATRPEWWSACGALGDQRALSQARRA
ncbi:4-(cytidine 5'-diphospho)-2-C-methyl-D-erythritol kinase [Paenirhodobacter populi]|uniref:4-diphosphocytidyl-2-C-methyl-D-erythritol kinase n=1 Tax=Paenirhodobacter populi TaxID=2306993 RepID=A0A443J9C3_9RHOB|nr:4-(cytidine 5'-diphospho)-2-C-methyl-D-erythritol kinase [Sinirhodobacter populi]RWR17105.1 4-(cytidine 5'-diphospho)-2-C-methyl-D-erythritol kinase [Sinirhodobacter populi]